MTERAARGPKTPNGVEGGPPPADEQVDRDALHPADYGSRRDESGEDAKQGGVSSDDVEGGGRLPTGERDYDPHGDRVAS